MVFARMVFGTENECKYETAVLPSKHNTNAKKSSLSLIIRSYAKAPIIQQDNCSKQSKFLQTVDFTTNKKKHVKIGVYIGYNCQI